MEKEEDALRKERERLEGANNREVVNLNLKPCDLSLMHLNQRLSHWTNEGTVSCLDMMRIKAMAPHSSTLAWKIPCTEEPGRLQSMGSLRVEHDWATSLSLFTFMHWRRKWQPTPVFLPGESQWRGSLVGYHLWDHTESDMTEVT